MKKYAVITVCLVLFAGCQRRETGYSGSAPSGRETGTSQSTNTSYSRSQTNASAQPSMPSQGRSDQSAAGTPGRQRETGTQTGQSQTGSASDRAITSSVKASLQTGVGDISAQTLNAIRISTSNGRVTLKGNVSSDAEKQEIEKQVKQIPGVQTVDNQLTVGQQGTQELKQGESQPQTQTQSENQNQGSPQKNP